jgi:hypothetical protein
MNFRSVRSIAPIAIPLLAVACVTVKESDYEPVPAASNASARLQWSPEVEGKKLGIGIGIVRPVYDSVLDLQKLCKPPHECDPAAEEAIGEARDSLRTALQRDIENALLAKGFNVTGKFDKLEDMTYAQKEKSNLVLIPKIVLTMNPGPESAAPVNWRHPLGSEEPDGQLRIYRLQPGRVILFENEKFEGSGRLSVTGRIEMYIHEPLSSEKMWFKPLDISPQSQRYAFYYWREKITDKKGNVIRVDDHPIAGYDTRGDAVVKAFEAIYPELYEKFKAHFNKEEMTQVQLDAEKIRKLKRY